MSSSPTDTDRAATSSTPQGSAEGSGPAAEGRTEVVMPQMGVSVAEGTIAGWIKRPGDEVAADETICEVTTDKIDVEIPAPAAGVLSEVLVEEGETVSVGTVLAYIGAGAAAEPGPEGDREAAGPAPAAARPAPEAEQGSEEIDRSGFYSPVVRRMAEEEGVDLDEVEGHGVGGRVRKTDLLAHIRARREAAAPAGNGQARPLHTESPYRPDEDETGAPAEAAAPAESAAAASADELFGPSRRETMDPMRKAIARHMVDSRRTSAHCTTVVEADFSAVARQRAELKETMARRGVPLTYLAFVAKAAVEGLGEHPVLNASVEGEELVLHDDVNLGIAVALESGLVVPVIRKAQRLSLEGMAAAIAEAAGRAREGTLEPDDLAGGTFTITNPGQFGAVLATPIIHQPQVAILDLEAIVRRPVVVDGPDGTESIGIKPMSYLCMSWDHRALDGAGAARFLADLRARIESWRTER